MERLQLTFTTVNPGIDETPAAGEAPESLVTRLAQAKALKATETGSGLLVIGSDQVAVLNGRILAKPGSHVNAVVQLRAASGQCVRFLTGICVVNSSTGKRHTDCVATDVYFRDLSDQEIESYLSREQPYQCAGSFKSERLGIALVKKMTGPDPSAIIGLPLIRLCEMLHEEGIKLL
jgi:septum formation protein